MNAAAHHHSIKPHHNIGIHFMQTFAWFGISLFGMGLPVVIAMASVFAV